MTMAHAINILQRNRVGVLTSTGMAANKFYVIALTLATVLLFPQAHLGGSEPVVLRLLRGQLEREPSISYQPTADQPNASFGTDDLRVHDSVQQVAFNLDDGASLLAAARLASRQDELILMTSDRNGLGAASNLARQLDGLGLRHHLLLADVSATCAQATQFSLRTCGFTTAFAAGVARRYGAKIPRSTWMLWLRKWLVLERLVRLAALNVLALDSDALVLSSPYPTLRSAALRGFCVVIAPEASRVNLGFVYVRGGAAALGGGTQSMMRDLIGRLRLFLEGDRSADFARGDNEAYGDGDGEAGDGAGAAGDELCVLRSPHRRVPSLQGLWDQGVWTGESTGSLRLLESACECVRLRLTPQTVVDRCARDGDDRRGRVRLHMAAQ